MGDPVDHSIVDAAWAGVFTALVGGIGWLISRAFTRMDRRHERAEDKFEEQDEKLADHETRITVIEKTK